QHKNEPMEKDYNCIDERFITNRVCLAAVRIAKTTNVSAIVTLTHSGYTAFQLSAHRPNSHIIVYSGNKRVITMLNLLWGVRAYYYDMKKP
ncbi:pyruvate kinase alpha/beta domain-containing protein, partial [Chryseobacterium sp. SIMBA_028]